MKYFVEILATFRHFHLHYPLLEVDSLRGENVIGLVFSIEFCLIFKKTLHCIVVVILNLSLFSVSFLVSSLPLVEKTAPTNSRVIIYGISYKQCQAVVAWRSAGEKGGWRDCQSLIFCLYWVLKEKEKEKERIGIRTTGEVLQLLQTRTLMVKSFNNLKSHPLERIVVSDDEATMTTTTTDYCKTNINQI